MRTCPKCQQEKEAVYFSDCRGRIGGKSSYCKTCKAEYMREWRILRPWLCKKEYSKNPERFKSYVKTKRAIKRGKLKKENCKVCGSIFSEAHHQDYSKPLEVEWLCKKHHAEIHSKNVS